MSKKRGGVAKATLSIFCEIRRSRSPKDAFAVEDHFVTHSQSASIFSGDSRICRGTKQQDTSDSAQSIRSERREVSPAKDPDLHAERNLKIVEKHSNLPTQLGEEPFISLLLFLLSFFFLTTPAFSPHQPSPPRP